MNPNEITCEIHGTAFVFDPNRVDYNCTLGCYECPACRAELDDEPYYEEVPGDPTDRAAYFAHMERVAASREVEPQRFSLVEAMRGAFKHDHPLMFS